jgi:hypothetical protein
MVLFLQNLSFTGMAIRSTTPPVLRVDRRAWWPCTVHAKIYAREEWVVDWSSVGTLEEGLELRYGPRKDWQAMDESKCERSGVPVIFRWGGGRQHFMHWMTRGV